MKDVRLERLAQLICRYSVGVKEGDVIVINYDPVAEPAAKEVYREVLALGGHPMLDVTPGWTQEIFYKEAQPHQLDYRNKFQLYEAKHTRARIVFHASSNTRRNSGVDAKLIARAQVPEADSGDLFRADGEEGMDVLHRSLPD